MVFAFLETAVQWESPNLMYTSGIRHSQTTAGSREESEIGTWQITCFRGVSPLCGDFPRHVGSCPQSHAVFFALPGESGYCHFTSSIYEMYHIYILYSVSWCGYEMSPRGTYIEGLVPSCPHDGKLIETSGSDTVEERSLGYAFKVILGLWYHLLPFLCLLSWWS